MNQNQCRFIPCRSIPCIFRRRPRNQNQCLSIPSAAAVIRYILCRCIQWRCRRQFRGNHRCVFGFLRLCSAHRRRIYPWRLHLTNRLVILFFLKKVGSPRFPLRSTSGSARWFKANPSAWRKRTLACPRTRPPLCRPDACTRPGPLRSTPCLRRAPPTKPPRPASRPRPFSGP